MDDRNVTRRRTSHSANREAGLDGSNEATAIKLAVNEARTKASLSPLVEHAPLETAAQNAATAMADAVCRSPANPQTPDIEADSLREGTPGLAQMSWRLMVASTTDSLVAQATESSIHLERTFTHMAVGVCEGMLTSGQRFFAAAVISAELLPSI